MYVGTFAERQGFEPWVPKRHNGFRDRPDRPLRHLSSVVFDSGCKVKHFFVSCQIFLLVFVNAGAIWPCFGFVSVRILPQCCRRQRLQAVAGEGSRVNPRCIQRRERQRRMKTMPRTFSSSVNIHHIPRMPNPIGMPHIQAPTTAIDHMNISPTQNG